MSSPSLKVEIGLDIGILDPTNFILDDPIKGLLDNTEFTLGGAKFFDITDRVLEVTTRRGKSQALDRNNAGIAVVVVDNSDRLFDPLYEAGIYFGQLIPRREVRISANGNFVMIGFVEDFDIIYQPGERSRVRIDIADGFSTLANSELPEITPDSEFSGARITRILDLPEVAWPVNRRDIEPGNSLLLDVDIDEGTNTLGYLQLVESSEFGNVFIAKDGKFTFKQRNAIPNDIDLAFTDDPTIPDFTPVPFTDLNVVYGSENLFNRVVLENADIFPEEATAEDIESQNLYGVRVYSQSGILVQEPGQVQLLADFVLARFSQPQYRFDSISVNLDILNQEQQTKVLDLEIGDIVKVKFTPSGISPAIEQFSTVIGVNQSWNPASRTVSFALERLDFSLFILDNPLRGVLDQDRLSF
jgi:hypothetical protein